MAPRLPSRATSIREPRLVPGRVRFKSVSSHISAPQTHLDNVNLSTSTVIQLHALCITATSPRVRQCTSWTTTISSDGATRKCLNHRHRHTTFPSCPITLQPDVRQNPSVHSYVALAPQITGGGVFKSCRRTRRIALAIPWDRKVHPHTLTTTTPHTRTSTPHVDRTVRLVDLTTEFGGASS